MRSDAQGSSFRAKAGGVAVVVVMVSGLALGLGGLSAVGSSNWIEAGYDGALERSAADRALGGSVKGVVPLIVGDEQDWLLAPRVMTDKAVAGGSVGGYTLGDRLMFTFGDKGTGVDGRARTFVIVGIEAFDMVGAAAEDRKSAHGVSHVIVAREVETGSDRAKTIRLLISEGDHRPAGPSVGAHKTL